ncbi:hypothetical protein BO99DRAFT_141486 [Aspergillus violaceofuscus CBS 115571]|uniref:F-box domain-containing protein n=1 Tax=Aspergillus violaceofuscus (strain CBS 115571) TaxID=1450538 RepID=A0A2V5H5C5_ASPV1|nr:hypothetical protein BO99DRAFT_141486 [Aspergillus violaceofuscus CBS 115571]
MQMATTLPLELIYCILDYLDMEDYIAARAACRKWRIAASTSSIIRNILQQVPVSLPSRTDLLTKEDWNNYICQIVRQNLLGCRNRVQRTQSRRELPSECSHCTIYDISRDGRKLVVLKGARALLYSRSDADSPWELLRSSPLYSLWTSVCPAVLGAVQHAEHRIALSSDGQFLAVGLNKTIQIYSLLGDLDGLTSPAQHAVNQENRFLHPPPANYEETNGTIESLEFAEDDDTLLRIAIAQDTTAFQPTRVRYLGDPDRKPAGPASLAYWRATINQVYLDSASMAGTLSPGDRDKVSLQGLQLLPRSYHCLPGDNDAHPWRRYFTACLQSTSSSSASGYCIGQVETSSTLPSSAPTITIVRLLPSRQAHSTMPQITPFTIPSDLPPPSPTTDPSKPTPITPQTNPSDRKSTFRTTDTHHKTTTLHAATTARWNTANLPTAAPTTTNAAPLLAVSPDASLMCLYEPGTGHYSSIAGGGALYLYSLQNGEPPARLLQATKQAAPEAAAAAAAAHPTQPTDPTTHTALLPKIPGPDPEIPTWSLLLDITDEDIQSLRITPIPPQHHNHHTPKKYKITATTSANAKHILSWRV